MRIKGCLDFLKLWAKALNEVKCNPRADKKIFWIKYNAAKRLKFTALTITDACLSGLG